MARLWFQEKGRPAKPATPSGITQNAATVASASLGNKWSKQGVLAVGHPDEWIAVDVARGKAIAVVWIEPSAITLASAVIPAKFMAPAGAPIDPNPRKETAP